MKFFKLLVVAWMALAVVAVGAWASSDNETEVKGTLNAVDVPGLTVTVNGQVYSVSANVDVEVDHQGHISFSQLPNYVGRSVELKRDANATVYKIEVKDSSKDKSKSGKSKELKGTLQAVDTANWTITVAGQTLNVSTSAVIEIKQGKSKSRIAFSELPNYIGKIVEVKLDANKTAYKIEVKM